MRKRLLCAALAFAMLVSTLPVTAWAEEDKVLHTLNALHFPAAFTTIIGEVVKPVYQYENEDAQDNNDISRAEYVPQDRSIIVGYVGDDNDEQDFYKITLDQSCHLDFLSASGTDGWDTTVFQLLDGDGELLVTANYDGVLDTDDYYSFQMTLPAGTYYIRVSDSYVWTSYLFTFILTPALDAPVVTVAREAATGKPVLTWEAVKDAFGYEVYRSDAGDDDIVRLGTAEGTSYTDATAETGWIYDYRVVAVSDGVNQKNSLYSAATTAVCALPQTVVSTGNDSETGKPVVSWEAVDGASEYRIYRSLSEDSGYELLDTVADGLSYSDLSAYVGNTYYYKVTAVHENPEADSAASAAVSRVCELAKPVVSVSNNDAGKCVVNWETVEGAEKYQVYRATSRNGTYELVQTSVAGRSYTDANTTVGKTYYYKVKATYKTFTAESGAVSNVGILAKPTVSISVNSETGKPVVKWQTVTDAAKYYVYRSLFADGDFEQVYTAVSARSYTDSEAETGVTYYYKVRAIHENAAANSADSAVVSRVSALAMPVIRVATGADGKPVISWTTVDGAKAYEIYRSVSKTGSYEQLYTVSGETACTDETAVCGTTYYYKVKAVHEDPEANSAESAVESGICVLASPAVSISGNENTGKSVISWETVEGAAKYTVYRSTSRSSGYESVYTSTAARSYTDSSAKVGTTYYYKVKAIHKNTAASSGYSEVLSRTCALAKPVISLKLDTASGKPNVTFAKVSGAQSYTIARATEEEGPYSDLANVTATGYIDTDAVAGIRYYYKVKAIHKTEGADSAYSEAAGILCNLAKPTVAASGSASGKPMVSWDLQEAADAYYVYRSTSKSSGFEQVYTAAAEEASYTDEAAAIGTTYYYKVKAVHEDSAADSVESAVVSRICVLASPAVSISGNESTGKPVISWETVDGAAKYTVYRSTSGSSGYASVYTGTTAGSYTDKNAKVGTTYYYKVKAVHKNTAANSGYSEVLSRICALAQPVVDLKVDTASGKPKVTFAKISGAQSYAIVRATQEEGPYTDLANVTGTSYIDTAAVAGTNYYYKVKAIHKTEGAASEYSEVTNRICDLAKPVVTAAVNATGKPVVSWDLQEDAVAYYVYRSTAKSGVYDQVYTAVDEASYTDNAAVVGKTYYYKVKAAHERTVADSAESTAVSCVGALESPAVSISGNSSTGKPVIRWTAVDGAAKYTVYRSTSQNSGYSSVYTGTAKSYTDKNAKVGTTYYYKVKAIHKNTAANSAYSELLTRICALAKPVVELKVDTASGKPKVTFAKISGAQSYAIVRAIQEEGPYTDLANVTGTSYVDTTAEAGVTYYYKVKAIHKTEGADSEYSDVTSRICDLEKPVVSITRKSGDPALSWAEITGAKEYEVWRATSKTGKFTKVGTVTEAEFTDTGAKAGKTYYYKVMAIHEVSEANSAYSAVVSITAK